MRPTFVPFTSFILPVGLDDVDFAFVSSSFRSVSLSIMCLYCLRRIGDGSVKKSVKFRTLILARFGYFNARRPSTFEKN